MRKVIFELARAAVLVTLVGGIAAAVLSVLDWRPLDPALLRVLTAVVLAGTGVASVWLIMGAVARHDRQVTGDADAWAFEADPSAL